MRWFQFVQKAEGGDSELVSSNPWCQLKRDVCGKTLCLPMLVFCHGYPYFFQLNILLFPHFTSRSYRDGRWSLVGSVPGRQFPYVRLKHTWRATVSLERFCLLCVRLCMCVFVREREWRLDLSQHYEKWDSWTKWEDSRRSAPRRDPHHQRWVHNLLLTQPKHRTHNTMSCRDLGPEDQQGSVLLSIQASLTYRG